MLKISELFDLNHCPVDLEHVRVGNKFVAFKYPWEVLPYIKDILAALLHRCEEISFAEKQDNGEDGYCKEDCFEFERYRDSAANVWVHKTAKISASATFEGSCFIDAGTEIRPGAYIRGNAIVGKNCVVGNSTELKNVILFDNVQVPHYNYVGDSILGYRSHMGAGSITSNVKSDKTLVTVKDGDNVIETGLKKFGAILGDCVEVGCNSVLNPGTVVGKNTNIYPLSSVRGVIPPDSIFKRAGEIVAKR